MLPDSSGASGPPVPYRPGLRQNGVPSSSARCEGGKVTFSPSRYRSAHLCEWALVSVAGHVSGTRCARSPTFGYG